jgi:hypothetical protein
MSEHEEQQQQQDLAGYRSVDDLVKAYRASSGEAQRQRDRVEDLEARMRQFESQFTRQPVTQRPDPASRLSEYGVPVDALQEYVGGIAQEVVSRAFEPVARGAMARNQLMSSYPDYQKFESDVARFIQEDNSLSTKYQRMFSVDPEAAMEFAYLKYGESQRKSSNGSQQREQEQARADAQIPSNRSGDARRAAAGGQDESLSRGWEHYQKTGDSRPYVKARLRQAIPDDFLNR